MERSREESAISKVFFKNIYVKDVNVKEKNAFKLLKSAFARRS